MSSFRPPNWLFSQDGHIGFQNMANMLVTMARKAGEVVVKKKCSEVCARWIEFLHYTVNFQQTQPHFSWMRSFVNVLKTSSICFASSLVGVIIMAPTWIKRGEFLLRVNCNIKQDCQAYSSTTFKHFHHKMIAIWLIKNKLPRWPGQNILWACANHPWLILRLI